MPYSALKLTDECRTMVLATFPPQFAEVKTDHITVFFPSRELPAQPRKIQIVGTMPVQNGVQVLAVKVDGNKFRKDRKLFHLTVSVEPPRKPKDASDAMVNKIQWLKTPIDLVVTPVIIETV